MFSIRVPQAARCDYLAHSVFQGTDAPVRPGPTTPSGQSATSVGYTCAVGVCDFAATMSVLIRDLRALDPPVLWQDWPDYATCYLEVVGETPNSGTPLVADDAFVRRTGVTHLVADSFREEESWHLRVTIEWAIENPDTADLVMLSSE